MNLWIIFLTGLTTGGLSCLAVQGGLLASIVANQKKQEMNQTQKKGGEIPGTWQELAVLPVGMFLLAKLISHTILGFLLGSLGSVMELSLSAKLTFQVFTAIFMFATAANLLDLHPIFRYVVFQPPAFIRRMIKNSSKSKALFAPFVLGLMTVLIPCGVTQAMEVLVIGNGNAVQGALTMFVFVLGTIPLFSLIGFSIAKLSDSLYQKFTKVAAIALVAMSLYSINGALQALDAPISVQKAVLFYQKFKRFENGGTYGPLAEVVDGIQKVKINVTADGYTPKYFTVKAGTPVELTVETKDVYSCASAFTFKAFKIYTNLKSTDQKTFTLTPTEKGKFTFACSMGMYTGVMEVI
jgi:sulfite exporter TauE/SafE